MTEFFCCIINPEQSREEKYSKKKNHMISNYITFVETKVFGCFFCLVAFIDKALRAVQREQRASLGFTFPWKSLCFTVI